MSRISVVGASHACVDQVLSPGELAVDATAGNGGDTEFLCGKVGEEGLVVAIDIQESAISETRRRLELLGYLDRCVLIRGDHSAIVDIVADRAPGRSPGAVMFNLGYRPGGEKTVMTRAETTVKAFEGALKLVRTGGVVTIVVYRGHAGARNEAKAVEQWLERLDLSRFAVTWFGRDGAPTHRPYLVCLHLLKSTESGPRQASGHRRRAQPRV